MYLPSQYSTLPRHLFQFLAVSTDFVRLIKKQLLAQDAALSESL